MYWYDTAFIVLFLYLCGCLVYTSPMAVLGVGWLGGAACTKERLPSTRLWCRTCAYTHFTIPTPQDQFKHIFGLILTQQNTLCCPFTSTLLLIYRLTLYLLISPHSPLPLLHVTETASRSDPQDLAWSSEWRNQTLAASRRRSKTSSRKVRSANVCCYWVSYTHTHSLL